MCYICSLGSSGFQFVYLLFLKEARLISTVGPALIYKLDDTRQRVPLLKKKIVFNAFFVRLFQSVPPSSIFRQLAHTEDMPLSVLSRVLFGSKKA
jgi:hypothetical protein